MKRSIPKWRLSILPERPTIRRGRLSDPYGSTEVIER